VIQGKIHYINSQAEIQKTDLGDPKTITGVVQDVSDMHQAEQKIFRLSHFDALTGLAKRSFFMEKLSAAIQLTEQTQNQLAVLILDLDRFKRINKTLGHVLGDHILLNIAKRIRKSLQECEILFPGSAHEDYCIARFGGNEFAILLPEIDSAEQVSSIANQLIRDISRPFLLDTCEVLITTSIGICLFPDDADNHESIIRNADTALRQAKAQGRDTFRLYHVSMSSSLQNNLRLENDLRKALTNDELVLYAQPQVEMRSGRIFGAEILVRWLHPQDGIKLPGEFLPLALETGLIVDIDQWVLRQACRQLASWQEAGIDDLRLSVNVSGQLFAHSNVADVIGGIVRQSGVRPDKLEIELTESTIMKNNVETISNLNRLKGLGLNIAIDDFGTGYSSLSYLKNFPVDTIKIDRAFIRDLSHSPSDIAITRAIIALGESLGLRTICEGIETTQQKEMLLDLGCYHAQGYLFSKPEPIDTFSLRLGKNDKNDSMQNSCWPTAASMGTCRKVKSEL
jgi:diguanylate cyclase (GGDEF)-like protein